MPAETSASQSGLNAGQKAGIGVGATIGGLAIIALSWYLIMYRRRKSSSSRTTPKERKPYASELPPGDRRLRVEIGRSGRVYELGTWQ